MSTAVSTDTLSQRDDVEPVLNETRDRIATGIVTAVPVLALGLVVW
jgi:stearoyl-CoA desaturase (Delta-9 desaturase)